MKMLDTNICIYTVKRKPENVLKNFKREIISGSGLCISAIALAELVLGVEHSANPTKTALRLRAF